MEARKAELEVIKAKGGKAWTEKLQEELTEVTLNLVDVEEAIATKLEAKGKEEAPITYSVPAGTEDMVHLLVVKGGRRFNPLTGDEESKPYRIMLTYSEWQLFKNNFSGLGYIIMQVLHDKYNEAKDYVVKIKKK